MNESHNHKVILVTGGSSGFGKACVNHLAIQGHHVYGTSRLAKYPTDDSKLMYPVIIPMDVCEAASIDAAVADILQHEDRLDVLVNNAGYGLAGPV